MRFLGGLPLAAYSPLSKGAFFWPRGWLSQHIRPSMYSSRLFQAVVLLAGVLLPCLSVSPCRADEQIVSAFPATQELGANEDFSIRMDYSTMPEEKTLSGLGLRVHFDSSKLTYVDSDSFPVGGINGNGQLQDDSSDHDGDPNTDKRLIFGWFDLFNRNWPGNSESFPLALVTVNFTTAANFGESTAVNLTATTTAANFDFVGNSALIEFRMPDEPPAPIPDEEAIVLNELHYNPAPDNTGGEFIEIYNRGQDTVDISGWVLTGGVSFSFPGDTSLDAGGFLVLARNEADAAEFYDIEVFGEYSGILSNDGELIVLRNADLPRLDVDAVSYGDSGSWPIDPDGTGPSLELLDPALDNGIGESWGVGQFYSPGVANDAIIPQNSGDGDIVINEIMYKPLREEERADNRGTYLEDGDDEFGEYVELINRGTATINLNGWSLGGGVRYTFTSDTFIAPDAYVVVCGDPEATSLRFDLDNAVGPFEGKLDNQGERIYLRDSDDRLVDVVRYNDRYPWPVAPDDQGVSLECIDPSRDNSTAANWRASLAELTVGSWKHVSVTGEVTGTSVFFYADGAGEWLLDEISLTRDGGASVIPNGSFDEDDEGWGKIGNHATSFQTSEDAQSGGGSLHLVATGVGSGLSNNVRVRNLEVSVGETYTLSFWYLHLSGHDTFTTRLSGGGLQATVSALASAGSNVFDPPLGGTLGHGTPGTENVVRADELPPFVEELRHLIEKPTSAHGMPLIARIHSHSADGGMASVDLHYSLNLEETTTTLSMVDDGAHGDVAAGDGIYGVTIPAQASRTLVHYSLIVRDSEGRETVFPYPGDPSPTQAYYHYDNDVDTQISLYDLYLSSASDTALRTEPLEYVDGSLVIDGIAYPHMDVRLRGQRSIESPKKQWKFRFNRHQSHEGNRHLETMVNLPFVQQMIFDIYEMAGVFNIRSDLIRLHREGDFWGTYISFEVPNSSWLEKHGHHPDGDVYKARTVAVDVSSTLYERQLDTDSEYYRVWNKKTRGLEPPDPIRDLTENLNRLPTEQLLPWMEDHIDLDHWFARWALYVHMNVDDFTAHNYYMYLPGDPGAKWLQLAYDFDSGFTYSRVGALRPLYGDGLGAADRDDWQNGKFYNLVSNNPTLRRMYFYKLQDINRDFYDSEVLFPHIDATFEAITEERELDRQRWGEAMRSSSGLLKTVFQSQRSRTGDFLDAENLPEDVFALCQPPGGDFLGSVSVEIEVPEGWQGVYTLDGRDPRLADTRIEFTDAFDLTDTVTVRTAAYRGEARDGDWTRVRDYVFGLNPIPPAGPFLRSDCDSDGDVDLQDILFGLRFQFVVGSEAPSCVAACDVNADGILDISDSVYSLFFLFVLGHPQPPFPYPSCGISELPGDGLLGCDELAPNCSTKE